MGHKKRALLLYLLLIGTANAEGLVSGSHNPNTRWAAYVQTGIGFGDIMQDVNPYPRGGIAVSLSPCFIHGRKYFTGGMEFQFDMESGDVATYWLGFGKAISSPAHDFTAVIGVSRSKLSISSENTKHAYHPFPSLGLLCKARLIVHLPQVMGLGLEMTYNYTDQVSYITTTLLFALGKF